MNPQESLQAQQAEKLFINQAAHLLLALAGLKPLPKANAELQVEDSIISDFKNS